MQQRAQDKCDALRDLCGLLSVPSPARYGPNAFTIPVPVQHCTRYQVRSLPCTRTR
jgi:hypothetical protein